MGDSGTFVLALAAVSLGSGVLFYLALARVATTVLAASIMTLPAMLSIGLERNPHNPMLAPLPAVLLLLAAGAAGGTMAGGLGWLISRWVAHRDASDANEPPPSPNPLLVLSWGIVAASLFAPAATAPGAGGASFAFLAPDPHRLVLATALWGIVLAGFRGREVGLLQAAALAAACVLLLIGWKTIDASPRRPNVALSWGWLGFLAGLLGVAACSVREVFVRKGSEASGDRKPAWLSTRLLAIVLAAVASAVYLKNRF